MAEGEDLVEAAAAAGWEPESCCGPAMDVEPELLDEVSTLGSGTRVIGVYPQRWSRARRATLSVYLTASTTPATSARSSAPRTRWPTARWSSGPGCADPYSPKAVRRQHGLDVRAAAGAGAVRTSCPARCSRSTRAPSATLAELRRSTAPVVLCLGAEREGLPAELAERPREAAHTRCATTAPTR